jgi:flavodoxin
MKVLVAYASLTGNTKKVAEAIYDEIECDKEIWKAKDVEDLEGYDFAFLGFPTHQFGPDKSTREFLARHTEGKTIALFTTHATPEHETEMLQSYMAKFRDAAGGANVVGTFDCWGELPVWVKLMMLIAPDPKVRMWARTDESKGQPDETRLQRARVFAREMMAQISA